MAYRDPYANQPGPSQAEHAIYNPYEDYQPHAAYEQPHNAYEQQPHNAYDQPHNAYDQPHDAYDQPHNAYAPAAPAGEYHDEPFAPPPPRAQYTATQTPGFEKAGGFVGPPVRQSGAWDDTRTENLWTRGGGVRTTGRFCCCFLFTFLLVLISVVLALALWIRPPNIVINGVAPPSNGSEVQVTQDPALEVNLLVNITVNNPNYFDVTFKSIDLGITYPINNTAFGGGSASDVVFAAGAAREFDFPFAIKYKPADDPSRKILIDLAGKCGIFPAGARKNISVQYRIALAVKVFFVTVHPVISNSFSFQCPDIGNSLEAVLKAAGIDLPTLVGGL